MLAEIVLGHFFLFSRRTRNYIFIYMSLSIIFMGTYEEVCNYSGKTSRKLINDMVHMGGTVRKVDVPNLSTTLTEFLASTISDTDLSFEIIDKTIETCMYLTKKEINDMVHMGGIVRKVDVGKFYTKIFKKHFRQLFESKDKKSIPSIPIKTESKENFVELTHPDYFYQKLESEINSCYTCGAYTAVLVLSRKLLENLVIDVLRKKYGQNTKRDVEMYFGTDEGRFHDFTFLLKNLDEQKNDFKIDKEIINQFLRLIKPFRKNANSKAHSIVHLIDKKEELKQFDVQKLASLLIRLYNNI